MRSLHKALFLIGLAACGGGEPYSSGDDTPGGTSDAGGGGVSFGGAQDIGEFRGILNRGEIPGPKTLDANGFFNEHYNAPPQLTCSGTLCLSPGLSVGKDWLTGKYQAALQLSVNTNVDATQYTRLPMNLVVVVDHSGSMSQDQRLEKVKTGLHTLVDNILPEDRLAIISFDDVVTIDQPFQATLDRAQLHNVVNALQPRGGTNIHDGLKAGFAMLGEYPSNEKQNRVIFLSDGLATVGITSGPTIIQMATTNIARGIGLTTVGVGNDFDVTLMRGLAERGAGNFYYVENATAATEVFSEELKYFLSPLALDVKIEARTDATKWEMKSVVGSTLWSAGPSLGKMDVPAVFLASRIGQVPSPGGGRRGGGSMIFIQLEPHTNVAGKVADLTLSYRAPNSTERITQTLVLDYMRDPQEMLETPYLSYPEMGERYAMYNMFLGLRMATDYAQTNYNCSAATLRTLRTTAATWGEQYIGDDDIAADLVLVDKFLSNLRTKGANETTLLSSCPSADNPYPDYPHGDGGIDNPNPQPQHVHGCNAGNSSNGWLVFLGLALLLVRRRK
jgi:Ca-activated chloride channel family protein